MGEAKNKTKADIAKGVSFAPLPPWAGEAPLTPPPLSEIAQDEGGLFLLLDETAADLTGPERIWFVRRAELVTSEEGAERGARFTLAFDPTCTRHEVHALRVIRDGAVLPMEEFAKPEASGAPEDAGGDARLIVALPELRIGDIIETAFSTYGANAYLGDRHAAWALMQWPYPTGKIVHRLRRPQDRHIAVKAFGATPMPEQREENGVKEEIWTVAPANAFAAEPLTPPWIMQGARLQFSEWRSWAEIAQAFGQDFIHEGPLPQEVEDELRRIATHLSHPEERTAAILRFVQENLRPYPGALGVFGAPTRTIEEIFSGARSCDTLEAAKLFVAMAARVGIDAAAAVVSAQEGFALPDWLPTPGAFNHAVVRVRLDKETFWLDPSAPPQPSRLELLAQAHLGWALPLEGAASTLEAMAPQRFEHFLDCQERIEAGPTPRDPIVYEWRCAYRGWRAEMIRSAIAREGEIALFENYASDIRRRWPGATPIRQAIEVDQAAANVLVTLERYEIPDAWEKSAQGAWSLETYDLALRPRLAPLSPTPRSQPIHLGAMGRASRSVTITAPFPLDGRVHNETLEGSSLRFTSQFSRIDRRTLRLDQAIEVSDNTLPAEEAAHYSAVTDHLAASDFRITAREGEAGVFTGLFRALPEAAPGFIAFGGGTLAALALFWLLAASAG